jgi:acetoin:2,6-dichlorophenolindophenol oxidoreductase subunit beta
MSAPPRRLTIAKAMSEALGIAMEQDPTVLVLGEDIGALGGVFGTTHGLLERFGAERVRDTPISETAFIGAAVGLAAAGMRPVVELMFVDFFGVCMDAIYNLAAKQSYFSGGRVSCPMVLMTSVGGGYGDGGQHSQCLYSTFAHLPGLKVVMPSNAYDAKGLLLSAIADSNPVIFMFHKALQGMGWLGTVPGSIVHVPAEPYTVPIGQAAIAKSGTDITLAGLGVTVHHALQAAVTLLQEGIDAEVLDLRTIAPLDRKALAASVGRTRRLIVIDDDYRSCGVSAEVIASACEGGVDWLAVPARITYPDVPVPYSPVLEHPLLPTAVAIVDTARRMIHRRAA